MHHHCRLLIKISAVAGTIQDAPANMHALVISDIAMLHS